MTTVTSQLLCTFAKKWNLEETLENIIDTYTIVFGRIYVLENQNLDNEFFCTYNINKNQEIKSEIKKTISIHRKKETNTLYTINSLNEIIKLNNNNVLDYSFTIDWSPYRSSLLVTNSLGELKVLPTKLLMVVDSQQN